MCLSRFLALTSPAFVKKRAPQISVGAGRHIETKAPCLEVEDAPFILIKLRNRKENS